MKLTNYGVPMADKYHMTEESRRYLRIPLVGGPFSNFIKSLDRYFSSDDYEDITFHKI